MGCVLHILLVCIQILICLGIPYPTTVPAATGITAKNFISRDKNCTIIDSISIVKTMEKHSIDCTVKGDYETANPGSNVFTHEGQAFCIGFYSAVADLCSVEYEDKISKTIKEYNDTKTFCGQFDTAIIQRNVTNNHKQVAAWLEYQKKIIYEKSCEKFCIYSDKVSPLCTGTLALRNILDEKLAKDAKCVNNTCLPGKIEHNTNNVPEISHESSKTSSISNKTIQKEVKDEVVQKAPEKIPPYEENPVKDDNQEQEDAKKEEIEKDKLNQDTINESHIQRIESDKIEEEDKFDENISEDINMETEKTNDRREESKMPEESNYDVLPGKGFVQDKFRKDDDSNFFTYFVFMTGACIVLYVLFHNKNKVLALLLEGRKSRNSRRERFSASYSLLHSNLEEAIASNNSVPSRTNVLY